MLGENIRELRKQKGFSQETLAEQLNVVRQTVSKWEKGYSVPDADMLEQIANLFEVPVTVLLGNEIPEEPNSSDTKEIVKQLAIINDQLAKQSRNRRLALKIVLISVAAIVFVTLVSYFALFTLYSVERSSGSATTVELYCTLDGEEYLYQITYDDQYKIIAAGGDQWVADHVQTEQYDDANILMAQIEDYFAIRGGTCEIVGDTQ